MSSYDAFLNQLAQKTSDFFPDAAGLPENVVMTGMRSNQNAWQDLSAKWFGTGLTSAQAESNFMNAIQAQINRNFQERLSNTQYQRGVVDMQKAGINPALAMTSGASPAPTPSGATASAVSQDNGMGFGDLLNAILLPLQIKSQLASIHNVEADTAKKRVEAKGQELQNQYQGLVNKYYPSLTQETIDKIHADVGVAVSDASLKAAQTELARVDKIVRDAEASQAGPLVAARLRLMNSQADAADKAAVASAARALVDRYESDYMKSHNAHMSSSAVVALAEAIASWSGLSGGAGVSGIVDAVTNAAKEKGIEIVNDLKDQFNDRSNDRSNVFDNLADEVADYKRGFQNLIKRSRERWNKWNGKNVR